MIRENGYFSVLCLVIVQTCMHTVVIQWSHMSGSLNLFFVPYIAYANRKAPGESVLMHKLI